MARRFYQSIESAAVAAEQALANGRFAEAERAYRELIGQTHVVFVSQFVDQRVQRMEAFDITQLDEALARYDELTRR